MKVLIACEESQAVCKEFRTLGHEAYGCYVLDPSGGKHDQIIQPWMFGDAFEKRTCLWLKGVEALKPTQVVKPEPRKAYESGRTMPAWYADAWSKPKAERSRIRSKTFPGIAKAMATQWAAA
jgi:hypothetical protein